MIEVFKTVALLVMPILIAIVTYLYSNVISLKMKVAVLENSNESTSQKITTLENKMQTIIDNIC